MTGRGRLTRKPLWKISVATTAEAEEVVAELLAATFGCPAASHSDVLKGTTTVSVFLDVLPAGFAAKCAALGVTLRELTRCGLEAGPARVRVRKLPPEDWAESWKRHFKPVDFNGRLLVVPSWLRRKPRAGQAVVVLDPGLSFGTGQHATTGFCLRQLVARRKVGARQAFLDVGTGSGILAIAAAKLNYAPVHAFDYDPEAVRVAKTNAVRNAVSRRLRFWQQDLTLLPPRPIRQYDVVCANLLTTLLISERNRVAGFVKPQGTLVLAGILATEFDLVHSAYESLGFRLVTSRREREWRSGEFRSPSLR